MRVRIAFAVLGACACGGPAAEPPARSADVTLITGAADTPPPVEKGVTWAGETKSRWPLDHEADARESALTSACGQPDGALDRVAREVADVRARGLGAPDADDVEALLRVAGSPLPRARVTSAVGRAPLDDDALAKKLASSKKALTRCAVVIARTPHGGEIAVAIAVDGYAELAPFPMRARTGEWLTMDATVAVQAENAKLVVLGPRGAPRTVPTSLDSNGHVRARFALDRPGGFRVQLVADVGSGPRPLLEARVFADVMPPASLDAEAAPGEDAASGEDDAALARMVGALRKSESLPPLTRDPELDALARAHAEHMRDDAKLAHDVGDGDLRARFEQRGLFAKAVGENVAHAATVQRAHRALHASPSHRINLLRADYTHLGVGVARADDGTVYVCEVFAARR
ncbi:MAG TPA: CAP domain-containing protein [Labilithrix sp.]